MIILDIVLLRNETVILMVNRVVNYLTSNHPYIFLEIILKINFYANYINLDDVNIDVYFWI